ncbi:sensor histidine kinase [Parapedobacter koreensis]|uniref:histidine kinase n=1 Tax=Parapedobacter koreensis TaxID=332977 RepID=A0A1H7RFZ6_9SPHI|nr:7TM diverse intracellular signaling domain-containing protein [Parapedobacter koreensis]SEL59015.1 hypothetical protein SAMN05421740_10785 [Parapedobacter koreensis]
MCSNLLSTFLLIISSIPSVFSQSAIQFTENGQNQYIGKYLSIFQDSTRQLTLGDIQSNPTLFKPINRSVPNLGTGSANNWVKFVLQNNTDADNLIVSLSHTAIDEVTFYRVNNGQVDSLHIKSGDPLRTRAYRHQFFLFDVPLAHGASATCYLKLYSNKQLQVPIAIHTPKNLVEILSTVDILSAAYIGVMLSMILYNLFLFFSTRETHYFVYVNYIFWVTIAQAAIMGFIGRILPIENDWLSANMITFSGAMSGIGAIFFVKSFLQTAQDSPKFNKLLNLFLAGYLLAIVILIIGFPLIAYRIVNVVAGFGSMIVVILAFQLSRHKYEQTKYFLFAWCVFLISVIVYVLKDYDILPYNFFTLRSVQIGSAIEAVLLSFALAAKINTYRKEKEESQTQALLISKENEKLIREQNIILEQRVEERTYALKESNESLQKTLTHLKETQAQLVEAEKMASLGQLTAGVAHEINNPINFVTSNVAPLRRDINMIWNTLDEIEKIALSDSPVEEKERYINAHKDELDFDYLKEEIDFLLKGMHEGANRTAEIVKSLRIFSRVDEDSLKFADINEGLESTLVILNSVVKEGVRVAKHYAELPFVECYPGKLNQVFLNIITNALYAINKKFDGKSGGLLEIKTEVDSVNVYISIKDNGTGMPAGVREKIFEPFFTTKEVGEGTGLGMSIAYNTIKKHQGEIKIESEVGEGTNFILVIPLKQQLH